jgi:hypothetical protein
VVKALRDIRRGDEIYYSYGDIIYNGALFIVYGFVDTS